MLAANPQDTASKRGSRLPQRARPDEGVLVVRDTWKSRPLLGLQSGVSGARWNL